MVLMTLELHVCHMLHMYGNVELMDWQASSVMRKYN